MHVVRMMMFAGALALTGAGLAQAMEPPRGGNLTCRGPFTNKQTGADMLALYESDARVEEVADVTGEQFESVVAFPNDPSLRLELGGYGSELKALNSLEVKDGATQWTVEGFRLGMTPAELEKAAGEPVTLSGFEQLTGTNFGMMAWIKRGDCTVFAVFYTHDGPKFDHPLWQKEVRATDPQVTALGMKVEWLSLILPNPPEE